MAKWKAGFPVLLLLVQLLAIVALLTAGTAAGSGDGGGWSLRKAMFSRGGESSSSASSSSSMVFNRAGSSVVFPLHGNVYPIGFYNVTVYIGQPPKPYFLDVDTGSDLTWLQCDAPCVQCIEAPHPYYRPSNNLVPCKDPICASLHPPGHRCKENEQCDYEVEYADGGSSLGVLVKDMFLLNFTNGKYQNPHLALGCGYDQLPGGSYHPIDGVLGLGSGKSGILSQLSSHGLVRNVVGHCLSGRGGGFLFFGDDVYDPSRVSWTPMLRHDSKHYSPGYAELLFGGKATGVKNLLIAIDSGSSYTYFGSQAYQVVIQLVKKELSGKPLREDWEDRTLPVCWRGQRPFKTVRDVKKYFKPLALTFKDGWRSKTTYEMPPESYLIISSKGNVCLGILNGTEVGLQDLSIIGDISMQDRMVIYDNEKQMIGWSAAANCNRLPRFSSGY